MPRNRVQHQKGLSDDAFERLYPDEKACRKDRREPLAHLLSHFIRALSSGQCQSQAPLRGCVSGADFE